MLLLYEAHEAHFICQSQPLPVIDFFFHLLSTIITKYYYYYLLLLLFHPLLSPVLRVSSVVLSSNGKASLEQHRNSLDFLTAFTVVNYILIR